jgi:hypothetical protein
MEDDILTNNMLVHIDVEVMEDYNYEDIIDDFNDVKKRRVCLSVYRLSKSFILVYVFGINILFSNIVYIILIFCLLTLYIFIINQIELNLY